MLIIADKRIPEEAATNLQKYGKLVLFETENITYRSISGHPDIFFCKTGKGLVISPNLPEKYKSVLKENNITFSEGEQAVGEKYPYTAGYNAVFTKSHLIHNFRYTDSSLTKLGDELDLIHVNQGYCRCNLLPLDNENFITSDKGIEKVLIQNGLKALYVDPSEIILPNKPQGFFGGCCGIWDNKIFLIGSLPKLADGDKVKAFTSNLNFEIIELYDGPLFDGGSVLFI